MDNNIEKELIELIEEAEKQVDENPSAEQVIVVKTAKDNIYYIANNPMSGDTETENLFVQELIEDDDIVLKYIVCMWEDKVLDQPSINFKKRLLEASSENMETFVPVNGGDKILVKRLNQTMPQYTILIPKFKM